MLLESKILLNPLLKHHYRHNYGSEVSVRLSYYIIELQQNLWHAKLFVAQKRHFFLLTTHHDACKDCRAHRKNNKTIISTLALINYIHMFNIGCAFLVCQIMSVIFNHIDGHSWWAILLHDNVIQVRNQLFNGTSM